MGRWIFLCGVITIAVGLVLAAVVRLSADEEPSGRGGWGGGGGSPVAVSAVEERAFAEVVEALGTARAAESVTITSRVTEVISRVAFDSGDAVAAGDVLVELGDDEEVAELSEARATRNEARRSLARFEDLTARGVAAQSRLDEARAALDRASARVRAIEARRADRIIRAPFDGLVGLRDVSLGALVRPGDVIATLDDVSQIDVDFTVPEVFLGALSAGAPLAITASAYPGETFPGVIANVSSRIDPVTRTATVRATVDNADGRLRPGMLMLVELRQNDRMSTATPELALLRRGDEAFVYVVEDGERGAQAVRRVVTTGARDGGWVEIASGLALGERVVAEGVHRIRPGMPVRVVSGPGAQTPDAPTAGGRGGAGAGGAVGGATP